MYFTPVLTPLLLTNEEKAVEKQVKEIQIVFKEIGREAAQCLATQQGSGVREIAGVLRDIGNQCHRNALVILQLRQRTLRTVGSARSHHEGYEAAEQEQRDQQGDRELHQAVAALAATRPSGCESTQHL